MCLDVCNLRVPKASCIFTELIIRQSLLEGPWASLDVVFKTQVNGIRTVSKKRPKKFQIITNIFIRVTYILAS